jgi:hypothetical protein
MSTSEAMKLAKLIGFAITERMVGLVSLSYFLAGLTIVTEPVTSPSA